MKTTKIILAVIALGLVMYCTRSVAQDKKEEPNYGVLFADKIEKTEGIALCPDGSMYVSENESGKVYKIIDDETIELFSEGYEHTAGMACDSKNRVYIVEFVKGTLRRISADGKTSVVIADMLIEPNGLAAASDGTIYVSMSKASQVLAVAPDGTKSTIVDNINYANGLLLNEDETMLYVNSTTGNTIYMAPVKGDNVGKKKPFAKGLRMVDGITGDGEGTIYVCLWATGEIAKVDSKGKSEIIAKGMTGPASPVYRDSALYITSLGGKGIYKLPVKK